MTRVIKFRVFDSVAGMLTDITGFEGTMGVVEGIFYDGDYIGRVEAGRVLMQFTGLLDKNGKEIYEGDIDTTDDDPMVVVFKDGSFGLEFPDGSDFDNSIRWDRCEISGNIYVNPELLLR